jgi:hypothetical protein
VKSFAELDEEQRERAVEENLRRLVRAIRFGGLRFNDVANGSDLQARIDEVLEHADPDLADVQLLVSCGPELSAIARQAARDAIYVEGETVIALDDL